jgi:hypothetical protein
MKIDSPLALPKDTKEFFTGRSPPHMDFGDHPIKHGRSAHPAQLEKRCGERTP